MNPYNWARGDPDREALVEALERGLIWLEGEGIWVEP